jgi:hypothetical protein
MSLGYIFHVDYVGSLENDVVSELYEIDGALAPHIAGLRLGN